MPTAYEAKFATFIRMIDGATASKIDCVVVHSPQVLGDTYEEIVESLNRLAGAQLAVAIVPPTPPINGHRTSPLDEVQALAELERAARAVDQAWRETAIEKGAKLPGNLAPTLSELNGALYELDESR
jgi:hypothetical protein